MARPGLESFRHKSKGYRAVLRSDGVAGDMQARADRVKRAAEPNIQTEGVELNADVTIGKARASATVFGVPMSEEMDRRVLGRAIDAAR